MAISKFTDLHEYKVVARRQRRVARRLKVELLRRVRQLVSVGALEEVARLLDQLKQSAL